MRAATILALAALAALAATAFAADDLSPPNFAERESGLQKSTFVDDGQAVMDINWTLDRSKKNGRTLIHRKVEATWFLEKEPIPWKEDHLMEIAPGGVLRTLTWKKDSYGDEQQTWEVVYDWKAMKVRHKWTDRKSGKIKENTLDLDESVITGESLELILRGFPFEKGEGYRIEARLLFNGESFLNGHVIHRGEQTVETPLGKVAAYKLELKPTGLKGRLAPTMYYYFTKSEPHLFVLLDGREAGPFKPRTKNVLTQYEPRDRLAP